MGKINLKNQELIREAVRAAESETSVEIVPVILYRSRDYAEVAYALAILGVLLFSILGVMLWFRFPFRFELAFLLTLQGVGILGGWGLGQLPFVIRWFSRPARLQRICGERAMVEFLRLGLTETKHRNGILVFLSLLEHQAVILSDRGAHEKLGEGYWKEKVEKLTKGLSLGQGEEAMSLVIREMGACLREYFPRSAEDVNEIQDHLRT